MYIDSIVYNHLYQTLWEAFYQREWNRNYTIKKYSQALWEVGDESGELTVKKTLLKDTGLADERYLYRRYLQLKPDIVTGGKIDELVIYNALEYLGFTVDTTLGKNESLYKRSQNLLQQFTRNYLGNVKISEQKGVTPMDTESNDASTSENIENARAAILGFYEKIGARDYKGAWELMSPEFQQRAPWFGDAARFIEGYTNSAGLRDITVFNVAQRQKDVVEALVYCESETAAYNSAPLSSLSAMTVANLDDFVENVKSIQAKVEEHGGQNFDKIELYKLFEQASSEYIWYKCQIKPENIPDVFPVQRTVNIKRLFTCTCQQIGDKWLLQKIRGERPQSPR